MRKLRVTVIDLVVKAPTKWLFGRMMNANQASIMPQVVARWCEQEGHDVNFICYTGPENLIEELPQAVGAASNGRRSAHGSSQRLA